VSSPVPHGLWRELVAGDREALPTQSPEWVQSLCGDGRYIDASRLYETADGRRAVLPMVCRAHAPGPLAIWHSMPRAWGFGGLISDGPVTPDLVASVVDDLLHQPALRIHIRPNPLHAGAWARATARRSGIAAVPARAHVLDLTGGFEVVWRQRFRSTTRRQVRRAEHLGVEIETDTTGRLVPEFYDLLRKSTRRWARHQHEPLLLAQARLARRDPLGKFESMAKSMGPASRIYMARFEGRSAAAILVLQGQNAHYTRGAMDEEVAGPSQANRLLHKVAIEDACRAGCTSYHMGESGTSRGLSQFKSRFGAEAHAYNEYWIERFPLTSGDQLLRRAVKRAIGFREVEA
jgi:hypothetical protein